MTDRELVYIITVAEEQNITHAAERLHVAQPSLTQCIRRLETELGSPLFVRRKYGLDLTQAGELYVDMARDILARKRQFEEELQQLQNPQCGHLSIGASWYNTILFLSDVIPQVNEQFPNVTLSLVEKGTNDLFDLFVEHQLNMMISHEYPRMFERGKRALAKDVFSQKLFDERFVLVAHQKYAIGSLKKNPDEDIHILRELPFISFNENQRIRRITDAAFAQAGLTTKKVVMTQSFPGAMELAEKGVGLAVLPLLFVSRTMGSLKNLRCYALPSHWNFYWSTWVYSRNEPDESRQMKGVQSILQQISERLAKEEEDAAATLL